MHSKIRLIFIPAELPRSSRRSSTIRYNGRLPVFNILGPTAEGRSWRQKPRKNRKECTHWLQRERGEPLLMSCGLWAPQECFQPTCEVQWQDACRLGSSQGMYNMVCTPVRNVQYPWRGHGNRIMLLKGHRDVCIPLKSRGCWVIYALQAQFLRCWCSGLTYASDGVVPVNNFWNKI